MDIHLITYDLRRPGQDYTNLIRAIRSYEQWINVCESCWAVKTTATDSEILDNLLQYIDANDKILVVTMSRQKWASYGLPEQVTNGFRV